MVVRLKSVLKSPVSPLALRATLLAVTIFWLQAGDFSFFKFLLFGTLFIFLYLKPPLGATKFLMSALVLSITIIFAPQVGGLMGFYVNLALSALGFLLLGIKPFFTQRNFSHSVFCPSIFSLSRVLHSNDSRAT